MKAKLEIIGAIAATLLAAAPARADQELFPQQVMEAGGGGSFAERMREPPLWRIPSDGDAHRSMRLFIGGHTVSSWSIRLEQSHDGKWIGHFREHNGRRLLSTRSFKIPDESMKNLRDLIANAGLWRIHPQFWTVAGSKDEICIDGMTVIFERSDSDGYRYSEGNAQCTMAATQLAVAAKMMRMAGRSDLERLLH